MNHNTTMIEAVRLVMRIKRMSRANSDNKYNRFICTTIHHNNVEEYEQRLNVSVNSDLTS